MDRHMTGRVPSSLAAARLSVPPAPVSWPDSAARVAVADLSPEAAKSVAAELGEDGFSVTADVTAAAVAAMVDAMVQQFGRLEIAVTSASVGMPVKALADTELAE